MERKQKFFWAVALAALVWRLSLLLLGGLADHLLPYEPSFPYARELLAHLNLPRWLFSWGGFDGVHYIGIATNGYANTASVQAFFPVFPLLLKLFDNHLLAGLILNFFLLIGLLLVFYQLVLKNKSQQVGIWSLVALLLFPTSFFFGSLYTETLFLLLVIGTFWAAREKKWAWAGMLAAIASGTRIIGILLLPALLVELYFQQQPKSIQQFFLKNKKTLSWLALSLLGLGSYMLYLWHQFGDPFYFFTVQSAFGSGRQESLVLLPQVWWRYAKILLTARPFDWKYFSYVQDLVLSTGVLAALIGWYKKIRPSYLTFSLLAFLVPTLTGTLSSMPRYVLVCFPIFMLLGELLASKSPWRILLLTGSAILLIINTVLFIQGYWVA